MYIMKPGMKRQPEKHWSLPDRIFFGHGACQILAGVYLCDLPLASFHAERIVPRENKPGNHIFVTDGVLAFDYHGYSLRSRLLEHHARCWSRSHSGWSFDVETAAFDLLDTVALNERKMRGPDQFPADPIKRARHFLERVDHAKAAGKARAGIEAGHAVDR